MTEEPALIWQRCMTWACLWDAVLRANWLGASEGEWGGYLRCAVGSASVPSVLKRRGLPARLADALCAELDISDRHGQLFLCHECCCC